MKKKGEKREERIVGRDIVSYDVSKLLVLLNQAFADEWLAYYQYWVCAIMVQGPTRVQVAAELQAHANEELSHATLIANRIIALDGVPLLTPQEWFRNAQCSYAATKDLYVEHVLNENIAGEQCAIASYHGLLKKIEGKDVVTANIILKILTDEVQHENDLKQLLQDLKSM